MRIPSPSSYKFKSLRLGGRSKDGLPKEGGVPRKVYDYLNARKGTPILNSQILADLRIKHSSWRTAIITLTDFWGMDIRSIPDCHYKCLCGEWVGDEYVDHIAQHLETTDY